MGGEGFSLSCCGPPSWAQGTGFLTHPLAPASKPGTSALILVRSWPDLGLPSDPQGARLGISGSKMSPSHLGIE